MIGKVRNMNQTEAMSDFLICCHAVIFISPPYTFCLRERPRIPPGLKRRMSMRKRKANTSS
jgi:hypothetical protein